MDMVTTTIWLLAFPLLSSAVIYLAGRILYRRTGKVGIARWLAVAVLLGMGGLLYRLYELNLQHEAVGATIVDISLRVDGISLVLGGIAVVLGLMVAIFSTAYMKNEPGEEKYYALLVGMIAAIVGLGCAEDLFNLWIWFEVMAVSSFFLVAFYREERAALEAGVKYLVQSSVGSALVLVGIALVYAQTGSLSLETIPTLITRQNPLLIAAGALLLIGFGVKTALVPLHTWLPDAHSQAPSGISAMLSGVVIEAGLVALLRSVGAISQTSDTWGIILLGLAGINMLVGNLMALRQTQVKRMLAFSSVAHIGYMLLGIGITVIFNYANGARGAFFHMITHGLMKSLAFLAAGSFLYALHLARGDHSPLVLDDLNGAATRYPLAAFAFSVAVLGLGGLPPLAGFMSKWMIFMGGVQTGNTWAILLVIFAALNSVLSLGYYAPLVNRLYRKQPSDIVKQGVPLKPALVIPLVILVILIVILGVYPSALGVLADMAGSSLSAGFGY
jgi:proton-translocating NADH-quinone oxidoreductase chain N